MNTEALFLFLILLLGLVLCSILGGNCNKEGFGTEQMTIVMPDASVIPAKYNDTSGGSVLITKMNDVYKATVTNADKSIVIFTQKASPTGTARIIIMAFESPDKSKGEIGKLGEQYVFVTKDAVTQKDTVYTSSDYWSNNNNNNNNSNNNSNNSNNNNNNNNSNSWNNNNNNNNNNNSNSWNKNNYNNNYNNNNSNSWNNNNNNNNNSNNNNKGYDNYNHYNGNSSQVTNGTTYYGPNGGSAKIVTNKDGTQSLQVIAYNGASTITYNTKPAGFFSGVYDVMFYGPNGSSAKIISGKDGQKAVEMKSDKGTIIYTQAGSSSAMTPTQYYGSTGYPIQSGPTNTAYSGSGSGSGSASASSTANNYNNQYSSSLPTGIPASQIPPGKEDLYILKTEVVPPVCPVCPTMSSSSSNDPNKAEKCPPCPACARCPEPSFECKKVPNYNAINNSYLPQPVVNDFSSFGM